jgi:hypothetical protein
VAHHLAAQTGLGLGHAGIERGHHVDRFGHTASLGMGKKLRMIQRTAERGCGVFAGSVFFYGPFVDLFSY